MHNLKTLNNKRTVITIYRLAPRSPTNLTEIKITYLTKWYMIIIMVTYVFIDVVSQSKIPGNNICYFHRDSVDNNNNNILITLSNKTIILTNS